MSDQYDRVRLLGFDEAIEVAKLAEKDGMDIITELEEYRIELEKELV
jgi:hypothetical protein